MNQFDQKDILDQLVKFISIFSPIGLIAFLISFLERMNNDFDPIGQPPKLISIVFFIFISGIFSIHYCRSTGIWLTEKRHWKQWLVLIFTISIVLTSIRLCNQGKLSRKDGQISIKWEKTG